VSAEPQLSLPDVPPRKLAHTHDPDTSHAAAALNAGGKASNRRECLLVHVRHFQTGLIDDEVASLTGLDLIEARRRCSDLRNAGLLRFVIGLTRTSNWGRQATVSMITPAGWEAIG
jgi:hypothetical protein